MEERLSGQSSRLICFGTFDGVSRLADPAEEGKEDKMNLALKTISKSGFAEAFQKVELYRYLNEPEEAESI